MIDFKELGGDGEKWELFARDFFAELGFYIDSSPDRGSDGKKDLIISEMTDGKLNRYPFRWLVSCKNNVVSDKSVSEDNEPNIIERCSGFKVDGFIGFYATIPSAALNSRLTQLKDRGNIKDFRIFDNKLIESYLLQYDFSKIILRYFPESYKKIRPLHKIFDKQIELKCEVCGKDLLMELYNGGEHALCALALSFDKKEVVYKDFYCACKGDCDEKLMRKVEARGLLTAWQDISTLAKPTFYLEYILKTIDEMQRGHIIYEQKALDKEKLMLMALAQKVFYEIIE